MSTGLQQAIDALQAGDKATARRLLTAILLTNPSAEGYLLLARASNTDARKRYCYEQVLRIDPANAEARAGLAALQPHQPDMETVVLDEQQPAAAASYRRVPTTPLSLGHDAPASPEKTATESITNVFEEQPAIPTPDPSMTKIDDMAFAPGAGSTPVAGDSSDAASGGIDDATDENETDDAEQEPADQAEGGQLQSRFAKSMQRWNQPFRDEKHVIDAFNDYVDELIMLAENAGVNLKQPIDSLRYAKRQHALFLERGNSTNAFLAPAVLAAATIAEALLHAGKYPYTFWVSNSFGEMCKILLDRNRERYNEQFERLILAMSCAVCAAWSANPHRQARAAQSAEIDDLNRNLQNRLTIVMQSHFHGKLARFVPNRLPQDVIIDRIKNEALARHFDSRLRYLLQDDRPRVKDYVTANMPLVYKLKLANKWDAKMDEWEQLLDTAGYDDLLRYLRSIGALVRTHKVGQLSEEQLYEIGRAAANNDFNRVRELMRHSVDELKSFLYAEAQDRLRYREPAQPTLHEPRLVELFMRARRLVERNTLDDLRQALTLVQNIWQQDIDNLELRDWVGYLQARTDRLIAAENLLEDLRMRRGSKRGTVTDWNLAVLAYERKDEKAAYQLLLPLLDNGGGGDEDLVVVVLGLALKLNDRERFLTTVPLTRSLRFHPLAIAVAHDVGDTERIEHLLDQILHQSQGRWELPPVGERFDNLRVFQQVINRAIVEAQVDLLVNWLELRINQNKWWMPNYLALAQVLASERHDIDGAFRVLRNRLGQQLKQRVRDQHRIDEACRDLLDFCKKHRRSDLGKQAYELAQKANASNEVLQPFDLFAPPLDDEGDPEADGAPPEEEKPEPEATGTERTNLVRPPQPPERFPWVASGLLNVRSVATYMQKAPVIQELCKIMSDIDVQESSSVVSLIQNISSDIETFAHTDNQDQRRVLYNRTISAEKRLAGLLESRVLSSMLAETTNLYHVALKQVIGDLSRQAGVGPNIEVAIENPFISIESGRSTLVLRLTNLSERDATSIGVEVLVGSPVLIVAGKRERRIESLGSKQSEVITFPIERAHSGPAIDEISFNISLHASAEGFPDTDLGVTKRQVPVKSLREAIRVDQIPQLFQSGKPLNPAEPTLFHGRNDILGKIRNSFYGGVQRERFFLDGIRRVGKTSILNFLPVHLPESVLPIYINLDTLGLSGPANSAIILRRLCSLIGESIQMSTGAQLELADIAAFELDPGRAFSAFLASLRAALPGQAPFLMVDEFQELLHAVARTSAGHEPDTLVLDQLRGYSDEGRLYVLFTGSIRFDRLSSIVNSRIFGSLTRLRVSFLSEDSVGEVLRAGIEQWATLLPETIRRVHDMTGGYPWLVQTYGAGLVDRLNREQRTVATPQDVDEVTRDVVVSDDTLFKYWWPTEQLGADEEHFIERLLRNYPSSQPISTRQFLSDINNRDRAMFTRALENLRACEVLDSTKADELRFSGRALRLWLEAQMQDGGQLHVRTAMQLPFNRAMQADRGLAGIFIDHENLIKTLERISAARGINPRPNRLAWFSNIMTNLLSVAEKRVGQLKFKVAVAFWERPHEAELLPAYLQRGFNIISPEQVKLENAVDFKLADGVHLASAQAMREGTRLGQAIIVTGDGDLSHTARTLVNDGVEVQIWGGSRETSASYREIVGPSNVVAIDDITML